MRKRTILVLVIMLALCAFCETSRAKDIFSSRSKLSLSQVDITTEEASLYNPLEINVDLRGTYNNPFDPDEISLECHFSSPSGKQITVPGFFYQDFSRSREKGIENLIEVAKPGWKVRFTPLEEGTYTYYAEAHDKKKTVKSAPREFTVKRSDSPGFLRVDKESLYYLKFDSGKPYFAVGESIAWVKRYRRTFVYDDFFQKLSENACNYTRIWLVEWNLPLEWTESENTNGKVHGLGKYSLDNSWRLDYIINLAGEKGIYVLLTLDTYGSIMPEKGYWGEERWDVNPYNKKNGGPCKSPGDFWTNEEAKRLYKRRLRYIVSRWGCSPNILAFELWNEVNAPAEWVKEMAGYIKEIDPWGHLVTTSVGYPFKEKHLYDASKIWNLPEIDYIQGHLYGEDGNIKDLAGATSAECIEVTSKYKKPFILAEIGLDFGADDMEYDKKGKGTHLHNALWASMVSRSFGVAMTHWKEYVDKFNLYYQFKAVSRFAEDIDWTGSEWRLAEVENLRLGTKEKTYTDLVLACVGDWGEAGGDEITVTTEGEVKGKINQFVHGMAKDGTIRVTPLFHLDYPSDGKFILEVSTVAVGADISVYVDGEKAWEHEFHPGPGKGEWTSSRLDKEYEVYIAQYDKKYEIPVSKGKHDVRIENTGDDWLRLKGITLTGYRDESAPFVRVIGLSKDEEAILWIQNKENTWGNAYQKEKEITPIKDISFDLAGLSDGEYRIEWWDTEKGTVTKRETVSSSGGILTVEIPEVATDTACKIRR